MDIGEEIEVIEIRPEPLPDVTEREQEPGVTEREQEPVEEPDLVPA